MQLGFLQVRNVNGTERRWIREDFVVGATEEKNGRFSLVMSISPGVPPVEMEIHKDDIKLVKAVLDAKSTHGKTVEQLLQ